jgi:transposase
MPGPSRIGRPRKSNLREVWNAIQYIATTGCQWALLPKCFPPYTTVQYYFYRLRDSGALDLLNEALVCIARRLCGRDEEPTAAIIDSQSVKTTEAGGPRGFDAGKKIKGRKRHIVTDTQGHMLTGVVHEANIQDRDGAPGVISLACASFSRIKHIFADSGYAGEKLEEALTKVGGPAIEIVKRPDDVKGFVLVARRWVVERTLAWVNRCRRLAKDWEATIASSEAWLIIASIRQLSRRIARNIN